MAVPDPLDHARMLLVLCRVIYLARAKAARAGVQTAPAAARVAKELGQRLAEAVRRAEEVAEDPDARGAALAAVGRIGEELSAAIDDRAEGIRGLVDVVTQGALGERPVLPQAPRRFEG